jgi:EmrB/QacA subfamily drug resistance transporter
MYAELSKRDKLYILLLCCAGQFMVVLDVSVVNVALPSIKNDLGFSTASLQWVVNAYTVVFAGFLLLGGRIADLLTKRSVFLWGFVLFSGSSLIGGLAPNGLTLVLARGVQGLGAAVLAPVTLSILNTTFTEHEERNHALGAWGATGGAGGAIGMLLGGLFTQLVDWRWVLFINVPIGVVAVLAASHYVPADRPAAKRSGSMDVVGAVAVSAGLATLIYAVVGTDSYGWGSARTLVPLLVGVALLAVFVVIEARVARNPLLPLRIFRQRELTTANIVVFLLGFAMLSMWYFVTLYLQQVLGYTPIQAGLAFVPMATVIAISSRMAGKLCARWGGGVVLVAGMLLSGLGMLLFALMPVHGTYLGDVLVPTLVMAVGVASAFVAGTVIATATAREESGLASGLVNTARQIGGSIGLAVLATVAEARAAGAHQPAKAAMTSGYHVAFVLGGIAAAVGTLIAVTLVRKPARQEPAEADEREPESARR